jgi:prephenate dehydratase
LERCYASLNYIVMSSKTVAIQGVKASFHDIAARSFFGDDYGLFACDSFADCFAALQNDQTQFAVVAIENSLYGSINEVYDLLLENRFWIVGEVYLRINQCLIGLPDSDLDKIEEVHSHPVALAQCEAYLDNNLPRAIRYEHHDTAGSANDIKRWANPSKAAIASKEAAKHLGLKVIAEEIETNPQNYTRFVILQKDKSVTPESNKTSMVLSLPSDNKPGALYRAMQILASNNLNMTMLQSRPLIGKAWHYLFYTDVLASSDSNELTKAVNELEKQGCSVSLLGSYVSGM